ncbi:unnamed protein product [Callosobruchus maculatus]|uniref:Uncharacterized protein n=1 Tax=Callosobruchus maculatus TaxID=64391 RepID=A0A653BFC4_CALMS|nr:unnamed protein product [Callosobruchus maculatus]
MCIGSSQGSMSALLSCKSGKICVKPTAQIADATETSDGIDSRWSEPTACDADIKTGLHATGPASATTTATPCRRRFVASVVDQFLYVHSNFKSINCLYFIL